MKKLYRWLPVLPYALYVIGCACNLIVFTANDGIMPVHLTPWLTADVLNSQHVPMTGKEHLNFLADWIIVYWDRAAWSIGDFFLQWSEMFKPYCWGAWAALTFRDRN